MLFVERRSILTVQAILLFHQKCLNWKTKTQCDDAPNGDLHDRYHFGFPFWHKASTRMKQAVMNVSM